MTSGAFSIAFALLVWAAIGLALVRRAEGMATTRSLPAPWRDAAFLSVLAAVAPLVRPSGEAAVCGVACIALFAAAGADQRTGYLFDSITLPTAILVATLAIATGSTGNAAWGVVVCVGAFGALVLCSRGRWMGLGDVKALYAIGAAFGPFESLVAIFAACLSGIVAVAVGGRLRRDAEIRFGPHLAAGAAFALIAGDPILHTWMKL